MTLNFVRRRSFPYFPFYRKAAARRSLLSIRILDSLA
jgi:hypothetical protein